MKAQMLKIANVKNQKEFYRLYPTEAEFLNCLLYTSDAADE